LKFLKFLVKWGYKIKIDNRRKIIVNSCAKCPYLDVAKLQGRPLFCRHLRVFGLLINLEKLSEIHEKCPLEFVRNTGRESPYRPKKQERKQK